MPKQNPKDPPVLILKITGPGVRRGRVSVPDLVRLCEEAQNAINKQAEALEGKQTIHPGPTTNAIQHECTLDLIGIKANCTTLQFGLAKPQMIFPFPKDAIEFGAQVASEVGSQILSLNNGNKKEIDAGLLLSLYRLSSVVEGKTISQIEWITPKHGTHQKKISAPVTKTFRERAAARLSRPRTEIRQIDGILDMADFKPKDSKCRIDPPIGASIMCTFEPERANEIYKLMRKPVTIIGTAKIQPHTDRIESLHINTINVLPSFAVGADNFFSDSSIEELARIQKVKAMNNISVLSGGIPESQDVDEFLEEIYATRK